MKEELLSVVMPVYNAQDFLSISVGAILNQTYTNFELILSDDGSTDDSGKICDEYAEKDKRIKVFHKPNGGHSSAVNYGLDRISGQYAMVCDADDYYEPDAFEAAVKRIQESPECDAVIFAIYRPDKLPIENPAAFVSFDKRTVDKALLSGQTFDYCNLGFHVESTCAKIMRSEILQKYHVRMPEHLLLDEDAVFCLKLYEHCRAVKFDGKHIYHYEIRDDSFCRKYSDVAVHMLPLILEEQDRYINEYHAGDREYISANNSAVFAWFNEAEEHYFFNEANKSSFYEKYRQYRKLLLEPVVRSHIQDIQYSEVVSRMRKIRFSFYKNPSFPLFSLYYFSKIKNISDKFSAFNE